MNDNTLQIILIVAISYLLGSLPTAYIITRINGKNIFEVGSGNMGGTNVIRALGIWWGLLVIAVDTSKGGIAIVLARLIMPQNEILATVIAGLVSIVGHNWSLFAWIITGILRGGKGAATAFGTLLFIMPFQVIAGFLGIIGLILLLTRYMSLAVLIAFSVATVWVMMLIYQHLLPPEYGLYVGLIVVMVFLKFRGNIQRLLDGTERRLGERA
ncbi:MAG: glycerol-3-phosphate acyltransferase [Chloroflexi bacterium]|jgi:glycerol-3-phosphate acyltransferase PlsY|uniref:glycerol-3-phosphate acyltransferase n=1 Tax=Candidatus Flexifilum breve TaxID=3140694 RepID=UPI00313501F4|nr:glycerol-3-phosphate acyltransferase [Chloroflexota bacterium]MBK9747898.1 glycerol-3-phosphate acyltransferase [Chloroflexota bacterium]